MLHIIIIITFKTAVLSFQRNNFMCDDIYVCDIYHIGKRNFLSLFLSLSLFPCSNVLDTFVHVFDIYCIVPACLHALPPRYGVSLTILHEGNSQLCRRVDVKITLLNAHPRTFLFTKSYFFASDDLFVLCAIICHSLDIMISHACICVCARNIQLHDTRCEREATDMKLKTALICLPPISLHFFHEKWFNCVTKTNIVIQC